MAGPPMCRSAHTVIMRLQIFVVVVVVVIDVAVLEIVLGYYNLLLNCVYKALI